MTLGSDWGEGFPRGLRYLIDSDKFPQDSFDSPRQANGTKWCLR